MGVGGLGFTSRIDYVLVVMKLTRTVGFKVEMGMNLSDFDLIFMGVYESIELGFMGFTVLCMVVLLKMDFIGLGFMVKTYIIRITSQSKPSIFPTHFHWYTSEFISSPLQILYTYDIVFYGFSANLSLDCAASLTDNSAVLAIIEDQRRELHTTRSPLFLGLRNQCVLWFESDYGADVIVGVFDSGIGQE
ncbi:hypothetical protein LWI29_006049 [Acer saccharum]|uniref:Inhibitor I9 domain-containing protein n=1 Tax=Acer saccharum TaxID=4024 RepID=A0AA39RP88_ACESA|nr:hypothetical protein LWI29_006049 [Acer saccharum]